MPATDTEFIDARRRVALESKTDESTRPLPLGVGFAPVARGFALGLPPGAREEGKLPVLERRGLPGERGLPGSPFGSKLETRVTSRKNRSSSSSGSGRPLERRRFAVDSPSNAFAIPAPRPAAKAGSPSSDDEWRRIRLSRRTLSRRTLPRRSSLSA